MSSTCTQTVHLHIAPQEKLLKICVDSKQSLLLSGETILSQRERDRHFHMGPQAENDRVHENWTVGYAMTPLQTPGLTYLFLEVDFGCGWVDDALHPHRANMADVTLGQG